MSHRQLAPQRSLRALVVGPVFSTDLVGGYQLVLRDVTAALEERGWQVDARIWVTAQPGEAPSASIPAWRSAAGQFRDTVFERRRWLRDVWMGAVPVAVRGVVQAAFRPRAYFEGLSNALRLAEERLGDAQAYDVVLLCLDYGLPGFGALVTDRHKRVVIISLNALESELKSSWWPWERWVASRHLQGSLHPYLFRPLVPAKVGLAIFASSDWEKAAVRAGFDPHKARTIYFGIPLPKPLPRPSRPHHRILWVGRLTREKGLHWLLRALPLIKHRLSDVTVTVIAAPGQAGYRRMIMRMIKKRQLESTVTVLPPMQRADLQNAYATHDVLFFHSIFAEPVALVLMEAFAAGLPVVASKAAAAGALVRDDITCLCYQPGQPESLADAMVTLLTDAPLRHRLAANAQKLVYEEFSLDKMGQRYDEALRELISALV